MSTPGNNYSHNTVSGGRAHFGNNHNDYHGGVHTHNHLPDAVTKARKPLFTVPWGQDPQFVGREQLLKDIQDSLWSTGSVALTGAGGIGKSQAAIEYCWRFHKLHPDFHVLWIHAGSIPRFDEDYQKLARKLGLDPEARRSQDVREDVKDWLNDDDNHWLLVIDNADSEDDISCSNDAIRDALPAPRPETGMLLFTSRDSKLASYLAEDNFFTLTELTESESILLLHHKLKGATAKASDAEALALLKAVDFLPLSITQAAAYIKHTKKSISRYLSEITDSDKVLYDMLREERLPKNSRRDRKAPNSVLSTWMLTYQLICKSPPTANLLRFMACLDRHAMEKSLLPSVLHPGGTCPDKISDEKFTRIITSFQSPHGDLKDTSGEGNVPADGMIEFPATPDDLDMAIADLESLALISREIDQDTFSMHRYVQVITTSCLATEGTFEQFTRMTARLISRKLPDFVDRSQDVDLGLAQRLCAHATRAQQLIQDEEIISERRDTAPGSANALHKFIQWRLGNLHFARGDWNRAAALLEAFVARLPSGNTPGWKLLTLHQLLTCFIEKGDLAKAEDLCMEHQHVFQSQEHGRTTGILAPIMILVGARKLKEAEVMAAKVLRAMPSPHTNDMGLLLRMYHLMAILGSYSSDTPERADEIKRMARELEADFQRMESDKDGVPDFIWKVGLAAAYTDAPIMYDDAERLLPEAIEANVAQFGQGDMRTLKCTVINHIFQVKRLMNERVDYDDQERCQSQLKRLDSAQSALNFLYSRLRETTGTGMLSHMVSETQGRATSVRATLSIRSISVSHMRKLLEEGEGYSRDAVQQSDHLWSSSSDQSIIDVALVYVFLRLQGRSNDADTFLIDRSQLIITSVSSGAMLDLKGTEILCGLFLNKESTHGALLQILQRNVRQHRTHAPLKADDGKLTHMWKLLQEMQMRKMVKDVAEQSKELRKNSEYSFDADPGRIIDLDQWAKSIHNNAEYSFETSQRRIPVPPLDWHMYVSSERGWESEPDERKRIKTRFARHYRRREASFDASTERQVPRARSCHGNHREWQASRWKDLIPATLEKHHIWKSATSDDNHFSLCKI